MIRQRLAIWFEFYLTVQGEGCAKIPYWRVASALMPHPAKRKVEGVMQCRPSKIYDAGLKARAEVLFGQGLH